MHFLVQIVTSSSFPSPSLQIWWLRAAAATAAIMFSKKKKSRIQISDPSNFEHRVHTDFDAQEQKFVGLPRQWQSLIEDTARRPKPFIDATVITTVEPRKVGRANQNRAGSVRRWLRSDVYFYFYFPPGVSRRSSAAANWEQTALWRGCWMSSTPCLWPGPTPYGEAAPTSPAGTPARQEEGGRRTETLTTDTTPTQTGQNQSRGVVRAFIWGGDHGSDGVVLTLRDRPRQEHQPGGDPRHAHRAVRPPPRDEETQGRAQQQPRGQEPSKAQRERTGPGHPPPPPHRNRDHRDRDQVFQLIFATSS